MIREDIQYMIKANSSYQLLKWCITILILFGLGLEIRPCYAGGAAKVITKAVQGIKKASKATSLERKVENARPWRVPPPAVKYVTGKVREAWRSEESDERVGSYTTGDSGHANDSIDEDSEVGFRESVDCSASGDDGAFGAILIGIALFLVVAALVIGMLFGLYCLLCFLVVMMTRRFIARRRWRRLVRRLRVMYGEVRFPRDCGWRVDVHIRETHLSKKFVSMQLDGDASLVANRDRAEEWETFSLCLNRKGTCSLCSRANMKFVSVDLSQEGKLVADGATVNGRTEFELVPVSDKGLLFSLKSKAMGKYVSVCEDKERRLFAAGSAVSAKETFEFC